MIILLDIDGVMVPAFGWKAPTLLDDGFPEFSQKAVSGLNKIIAATKADIILTTSHKSRFDFKTWEMIFLKRGIEAVISTLPELNEPVLRKEEVLNWVQANPNEKNFVIIDDDKSLNDLPEFLKGKLILTSSLVGLIDDLAERAIEILLNPNLK